MPLTTTVLCGDLTCLARALRPFAPGERSEQAAAIVHRAMDAHEARLKGARSRHGDGSVMAAALYTNPPGEGSYSDPDWLDCVMHAARALQDLAILHRKHRRAA